MADIAQLYRHYNADGELLYVGVTCCVLLRSRDHRADSSWFREIATIKIINYPSREEAMVAEKKAIAEERPKHNIRHKELGPATPIKAAATKQYASTHAFILDKINTFLQANTHITPPRFGFIAAGDTNLVQRIRAGADISTRKLDAILRYLSDPNKQENHYGYEESREGKETSEKRQGGKRPSGKGDQGSEGKARSEGKSKSA